MTFDDNDLKRLKEHALSLERTEYIPVTEAQDILALIARLEAAEQVIKAIEDEEISDWLCGYSLKAWRKVAGKDSGGEAGK